MRRHVLGTTIVLLASYACLATLAAGWLNFERRSREELLQALALAKPGVPVVEIHNRMGQPMGEWSNPDDMLSWGTVKERSFCEGKRLLRFYVSTPPCRAMDVYTDLNGVIVYVTWTGL
ncbi:MAG: hypothetical protein ABFE01_25575 [Phycisphaerales bacterium]|jgi:hypothetical protein